MSNNSTSAGPDAPGSADETEEEPEVVDGQALVELLVDAGIMWEDDRADDLRLTDEFRGALWDEIETVREGDRARQWMAELVDVEPGDLRFEEGDGTFVVYEGDAELGEWPSKGAFLADLTLRSTLAERFPLWERLDPISRSGLLPRVRGFLEVCPVCDGPLELEADDASPSQGAVTLGCLDCGRVMVSGEL